MATLDLFVSVCVLAYLDIFMQEARSKGPLELFPPLFLHPYRSLPHFSDLCRIFNQRKNQLGDNFSWNDSGGDSITDTVCDVHQDRFHKNILCLMGYFLDLSSHSLAPLPFHLDIQVQYSLFCLQLDIRCDLLFVPNNRHSNGRGWKGA